MLALLRYRLTSVSNKEPCQSSAGGKEQLRGSQERLNCCKATALKES